MNIYRHTFTVDCPLRPCGIIYRLKIETDKMIFVEDIMSACHKIEKGFHEEIADMLHTQLGGHQVIKGYHHGVDIETIRGDV